MDRIQLERMRDEKRAELKFIDNLLNKYPTIGHNSLNGSLRRGTHRVFSQYTKTYKSPPSGKTWFDWMRSVVQSNGKDMLLATLGGLAFKSGFVLEDGDKLSNFVGRVYGLKLYMSDEEYPRMFVTISNVRSNDIRPNETKHNVGSIILQDRIEHNISDCHDEPDISEHNVLNKATNDCIDHILNTVIKYDDDVTS